MEYGSQNPLRSPGLNLGSAKQRVIARHLPLIFPLPPPLHSDVCEQIRRAVQNARVQYTSRFEDTVLNLNAIWDGVIDELAIWLDIEPRGMTLKAMAYLKQLPGYAGSELAQRLVELYAPPESVATWSGLDEGFNAWVADYACYVRRCFVRRDLPNVDVDPAVYFSRWLKDHETVSYTHPERAYCAIARRVQKLLSEGRSVIFVLVDALAIHVVRDAIDYFNDRLGREATWSSYVFAPIPTITRVCKEAILTGLLPDKCYGNLINSLCKNYQLDTTEVQIASSWQDGERLQLNKLTRLVVYRDNRLDDQLSNLSSYRVPLEECTRIFPRLAQLVDRWISDFRCLNQSPPVVLLTADHGFTYGPPPGSEMH